MKFESNEVDCKHMAALRKQKDEITRKMFEISQVNDDMKKMLESDDVCLVSAYKSRIAEFKKLPPKVTVSFSSFTSQKINVKHVYEQFGSVTLPSIKTEENGYSTLNCQNVESPVSDKSLVIQPRVITDISIKDSIDGVNDIYNVSCLDDKQFWTC